MLSTKETPASILQHKTRLRSPEKQHGPRERVENRKEKLEFPILLRWNSPAILSLLRVFAQLASFFSQEGIKQDGISLASKMSARIRSSTKHSLQLPGFHLTGEGIPSWTPSWIPSGKQLIHNKPRAASESFPKNQNTNQIKAGAQPW